MSENTLRQCTLHDFFGCRSDALRHSPTEPPGPKIASKEEASSAALQYRQDVCQAVKKVLEDSNFQQAADLQADRLRAAGGVSRAVSLIMKAADAEHRTWLTASVSGGA
eukprot:Skav227662  [mRNA]  locus=scaffold58:585274:585973:- [translate_table: standard]